MLYSIVIFSLGVIFAQEYPLPSLKIILINLFFFLKQKSEEIKPEEIPTQIPDTYLNYVLNFLKKTN